MEIFGHSNINRSNRREQPLLREFATGPEVVPKDLIFRLSLVAAFLAMNTMISPLFILISFFVPPKAFKVLKLILIVQTISIALCFYGFHKETKAMIDLARISPSCLWFLFPCMVFVFPENMEVRSFSNRMNVFLGLGLEGLMIFVLYFQGGYLLSGNRYYSGLVSIYSLSIILSSFYNKLSYVVPFAILCGFSGLKAFRDFFLSAEVDQIDLVLWFLILPLFFLSTIKAEYFNGNPEFSQIYTLLVKNSLLMIFPVCFGVDIVLIVISGLLFLSQFFSAEFIRILSACLLSVFVSLPLIVGAKLNNLPLGVLQFIYMLLCAERFSPPVDQPRWGFVALVLPLLAFVFSIASADICVFASFATLAISSIFDADFFGKRSRFFIALYGLIGLLNVVYLFSSGVEAVPFGYVFVLVAAAILPLCASSWRFELMKMSDKCSWNLVLVCLCYFFSFNAWLLCGYVLCSNSIRKRGLKLFLTIYLLVQIFSSIHPVTSLSVDQLRWLGIENFDVSSFSLAFLLLFILSFAPDFLSGFPSCLYIFFSMVSCLGSIWLNQDSMDLALCLLLICQASIYMLRTGKLVRALKEATLCFAKTFVFFVILLQSPYFDNFIPEGHTLNPRVVRTFVLLCIFIEYLPVHREMVNSERAMMIRDRWESSYLSLCAVDSRRFQSANDTLLSRLERICNNLDESKTQSLCEGFTEFELEELSLEAGESLTSVKEAISYISRERSLICVDGLLDRSEIITYFYISYLEEIKKLSSDKAESLKGMLIVKDPLFTSWQVSSGISIISTSELFQHLDLHKRQAEASFSYSRVKSMLVEYIDPIVFEDTSATIVCHDLVFRLLVTNSKFLVVVTAIINFVFCNSVGAGIPIFASLLLYLPVPPDCPSFWWNIFTAYQFAVFGGKLCYLCPQLSLFLPSSPRCGFSPESCRSVVVDMLLLLALSLRRLAEALGGRSTSDAFQSHERPTRDFYVWRLCLSFCILLLILVGWEYFSNLDVSVLGLGSSINNNHFSAWHVLAVIAVILSMVMDRCLYAMSREAVSLPEKAVISSRSLYLVAIQAFILHYPLIFLDGRNCGLSTSLMLLYLPCSVYLFLSSWQQCFDIRPIRPGLWWVAHAPTSWLMYYTYRIYRALPFVDDLRQLCDWTSTRNTCLSMLMWFKVEDCQQNLYLVLQDFLDRKDLPLEKQRRTRLGWTAIMGLVLLLVAPLLFFSELNVLRENNGVNKATLRTWIAVNGRKFPDIYYSDLLSMSNLAWQDVEGVSVPPGIERGGVDLQNLSFSASSDGLWEIPPPLRLELLSLLGRENPILTAGVEWNLVHRLSGMSSGSQTRNVSLSREAASQFSMALNSSNFTFFIEVPALWPSFISSGVSQETFFSRKANFSDLRLSINSAFGSTWWQISYSHLSLICASERAVPLGKSKATQGSQWSVIGLYFGVVLTVGRFLRLAVEGSSKRMIYEEIPEAQRLLDVCSGIAISRRKGDLALERKLYYQLTVLYRRPEVLFEIVGGTSSAPS